MSWCQKDSLSEFLSAQKQSRLWHQWLSPCRAPQGYIRNFQENLLSGVHDDNEVYQFILHEIEKCDNEEVKQAIVDKIKQAENYHEMKKMTDLLKDVLQYK